MLADFLRARRRLRRHGRALIIFLVNDLRKPLRPRSSLPNPRLVARGDVRAEERSDASEASAASAPPFVCGAGPLGSAAASAPSAPSAVQFARGERQRPGRAGWSGCRSSRSCNTARRSGCRHEMTDRPSEGDPLSRDDGDSSPPRLRRSARNDTLLPVSRFPFPVSRFPFPVPGSLPPTLTAPDTSQARCHRDRGIAP